MNTLDDAIQKRILAQKIIDSPSINDALEFIKKKYNLDTPETIIQKHIESTPKNTDTKHVGEVVSKNVERVTYEVSGTMRKYRDQQISIDNRNKLVEDLVLKIMENSKILSVGTALDYNLDCYRNFVTFDIGKILKLDTTHTGFERIK